LFENLRAPLKTEGDRARNARKPGYNHIKRREEGKAMFKQEVNKKRSQVRARVEHVFGHQATAMAGKLMRCIGMVRAKAEIGLRNLVYKMQRFVFLRQQNLAQG
jgi:transposase, IS5 family